MLSSGQMAYVIWVIRLAGIYTYQEIRVLMLNFKNDIQYKEHQPWQNDVTKY